MPSSSVKFNKEHFNLALARGDTSEEFSERVFRTSPLMLIVLPLVKRDGHILFNASC